MNRDLTLAVFVVALGAAGTYLLLPHKHGARKSRNVHVVGGALAGLALLLFAVTWTPPAAFLAGLFFYAFALAAVACAVLTVTSRDPVHSALWFAAVVLATSGLFMEAGAPFLAAGTVIVYAGAIIVTFLFVIMLAQMEGRAVYDRSSRMPLRATFTCFALLLALLWALTHARHVTHVVPAAVAGDAQVADARLPRTQELPLLARLRTGASVREVVTRASRETARIETADRKAKPNVAGLGATLYTDHLVTVELAGALLFVALIAAISVATPKAPIRPGDRTASTPANA